jgi:hypothetical protein
VKVKWPGPVNAYRPGVEGKSKTRLQILPWTALESSSRLKMVHMSLGVTVAHDVAGYAVSGCLELMGTRREVEMEPEGRKPEGWAGLAGHLGWKNVRLRMEDAVGAARTEPARTEIVARLQSERRMAIET